MHFPTQQGGEGNGCLHNQRLEENDEREMTNFCDACLVGDHALHICIMLMAFLVFFHFLSVIYYLIL